MIPDLFARAVDAARLAYCKDRHPGWVCNQKSLEDEMVSRMLRAALEVLGVTL